MTKTKTAAPTSAFMSASTLLLALVVAFELYGANALSQGHSRWTTSAAADGSTIYTSTTPGDERVVAQATVAAN
jgi:putative intracellular protease/amidase